MDTLGPFKGTIWFDIDWGGRKAGWRESGWIGRSDFPSALAALRELANKRLALLPPNVSIPAIRVTNPLVPRGSNLENLKLVGKYKSQKGASPFSILVIGLNADDLKTRGNLGGLPGEIVVGEKYAPTPEWLSLFQQYKASLQRFCVVRRERKSRATGDSEPEVIVEPIRSVEVLAVEGRTAGLPYFVPRGRRRKRSKSRPA